MISLQMIILFNASKLGVVCRKAKAEQRLRRHTSIKSISIKAYSPE